jgi:hypothetical protein
LILKNENDVRTYLQTPGITPAELCKVAKSLFDSKSYHLAQALYNKAYVLAPEDDTVMGPYIEFLCATNQARPAIDLLLHNYTNGNSSQQRMQWIVTLAGLKPTDKEWMRRSLKQPSISPIDFPKLASLRQYCMNNSIQVHQIAPSETLYLNPIKSFPKIHTDVYEGFYEARPVYFAELKDVIVSPKSHAIFVDEYALREEYGMLHRDDLTLNNDLDSLVRYVPEFRSSARSGIAYKRIIDQEIDELVLNLLGANTVNYYHWLIEWVPRILALVEINEPVALLIDSSMPDQYKQALNQMVGDAHKIIESKTSQCIKVQRMIQVEGWATVPCDVRADRRPHIQDVYIHPKVVSWLREKTKAMRSTEKPFRKIYLRRSGNAQRSFNNEQEVADLLESLEFEFISPEKLTFEEQVKIFSEAKYVFGPTGAAFTNLIFCSEEAHIMPMTLGEGHFADYSLFSKLADMANINLTHFLTNETGADHAYKWFSSFSVDINLLKAFLTRTLDS